MFVLVVISTGETAHAFVDAEQNVVQLVVLSQAVPPALQVCTLEPAQRVAPGVHEPVQSPSWQPLVQSSLSSHAVPLLLQLCTWLPTQRTAPAEHDPCPASGETVAVVLTTVVLVLLLGCVTVVPELSGVVVTEPLSDDSDDSCEDDEWPDVEL
jgi:hypothetical protein